MLPQKYSLVTVKEYAQTVRKSDDTVRRWIHEGKLEARKDKGGAGWLIFDRGKRSYVKRAS
jgi:excisionase family DNA binding protein